RGTGQIRQGATNEIGDFVFTQVLPGAFNVKVNHPGFQEFEQTGIVLSASERLALEAITIQVGDLTEVVSAEATIAPLQTESSERSGLIDSRQMRELSLKGRDYMGMLQLLPGIVDVNNTNREAPGSSTLQGLYFNGNRQGS